MHWYYAPVTIAKTSRIYKKKLFCIYHICKSKLLARLDSAGLLGLGFASFPSLEGSLSCPVRKAYRWKSSKDRALDRSPFCLQVSGEVMGCAGMPLKCSRSINNTESPSGVYSILISWSKEFHKKTQFSGSKQHIRNQLFQIFVQCFAQENANGLTQLCSDTSTYLPYPTRD